MARTSVLNRGVAAASQATGTPVTTPLLALLLVKYIQEGITSVEGLTKALGVPEEQTEAARNSVLTCMERFIPPLKASGVYGGRCILAAN